MSSNPPSQAELTDAIESATRQAVTELFAQHCEQFYYLTLITVGEALSPVLSAWSVEALERAISTEQTRTKHVSIWSGAMLLPPTFVLAKNTSAKSSDHLICDQT